MQGCSLASPVTPPRQQLLVNARPRPRRQVMAAYWEGLGGMDAATLAGELLAGMSGNGPRAFAGRLNGRLAPLARVHFPLQPRAHANRTKTSSVQTTGETLGGGGSARSTAQSTQDRHRHCGIQSTASPIASSGSWPQGGLGAGGIRTRPWFPVASWLNGSADGVIVIRATHDL